MYYDGIFQDIMNGHLTLNITSDCGCPLSFVIEIMTSFLFLNKHLGARDEMRSITYLY